MSLLAILAGSAPPVEPVEEPGRWTTPVPDPEPASVPYAMPAASPYNVATKAIIPISDGSGQTVHPDVIDFGPTERFAGFRYWMAVTGYAFGNGLLENPHIFRSEDGFMWESPPGAPVPLDPAPSLDVNIGYNSDTDMVFDPVAGALWVFFREVRQTPPVHERLYAMSSTDAVTWSEPQLVLTNTTSFDDLLSPAVVRVGPGDWRMWVVSDGGGPIRQFSAPSPTGPWVFTALCSRSGPTFTPWHIDVTLNNGRFYAVVDTPSFGGLRPMTSLDGVTWVAGPELIVAGAGGWDSQPYRASLFMHPELDKFRIWYSANTTGGPEWLWWTGYTQAPRAAWDSLIT